MDFLQQKDLALSKSDKLLLLPLARQSSALLNMVHVFRGFKDELNQLALQSQANLPKRASDLILVVSSEKWGPLSVFIALEVWQKAHPQWEISAPHSKDLIVPPQNFQPEKLKYVQETEFNLRQIYKTNEQRSKLLFIPVRIEILGVGKPAPIASDEFEIDLFTALWVMVTHWSEFAKKPSIKIACLGTRYGLDHKLIPIIGQESGRRLIHMRSSEADLRGCIRLIGINQHTQT
jgi:hypothetical protein